MKTIDVDKLSNFIRSIDGNNKMGAGMLSENIVEWLSSDMTQETIDVRNVSHIERASDMSVTLVFMSCRAASQFVKELAENMKALGLS